MASIAGDGYDETRRAAVEAVQSELAERLLGLRLDVILEFGFWSRPERQDLRSHAAALGADTKMIFLDVPRDELVERLTLRNAALPPDTFHVAAADLDRRMAEFEPPTGDELG